MRRSEARAALEAARGWNQRGMFKQGAFAQVERELGPVALEEKPSLAMQAFYAVGGLMLGAATGALFGLLRLNDIISDKESHAWTFFALCAFILLATGITLWFSKQRELGDAILLAGLVPTAITLGPQAPAEWLWVLPILVGIAVVIGKQKQHVLPIVGLALAFVATPVVLYRTLQEDPASTLWLVFAALAWAGIATWNRINAPPWNDEGGFSSTLSVAAASLGFIFTVINPSFDAGPEVPLGLVLLVLLGIGIVLRQRGVIFAASAALTIDAIVFAFDIGGATTGLIVLLGLSAALITVATMLRRRARAEGR